MAEKISIELCEDASNLLATFRKERGGADVTTVVNYAIIASLITEANSVPIPKLIEYSQTLHDFKEEIERKAGRRVLF